MESVVFESFPELFKSLVKFVKLKLLGKRSEVKLGLVFKPFNFDKKKRLLDRIRKINAKQKEGQNVVFDDSATTLIYGSDEDEDIEPQLSLQKSHSSSSDDKGIGEIRPNSSFGSSSSLLDESKMSEQKVYAHGSDKEGVAVKIVDKSKRAYDISADAVKSFELTISKPRNSCKYSCRGINAWFYSLFILCFKFHGKPPAKINSSTFSLIYSFLLAMDILLTVNIGFHIFLPFDNWKIYGVPFLGFYPAVTVLGPIVGVIGSFLG